MTTAIYQLLTEMESPHLLTKSDRWLEQQRRVVSTKIDDLTSQLRSLILAQRIKTKLQDKNCVIMLRDDDIDIQKIQNAIKDVILDPHDSHELIESWIEDGYDPMCFPPQQGDGK